MRFSCLLAPALACATGCTIVYNTDDLRNRDAAVHDASIDATPPDAIPIDADPALLAITEVEPDTVDEGSGGEGGRPVVLVVTGDSIVAGLASVVVAFTDGAMEAIVPDALLVSADQHTAAVALRLPVDATLAEGATRTLRLTFSQPGAVDAVADVTVTGLDELTLVAGSVAVASLDARYSHIEVTGDVTFTGTVPARLHATGDIVINGALSVNGTGRDGGPNGCDGGIPEAAGGCGVGRGMAGVDSDLLGTGSGGGGGGYGDVGDVGPGGGAGGMQTGNDMLVPLGGTGTSAGNRGNGGGGGGKGTLNAGGTGGGGGGVIEVVAGGDIVVTGGAISASGAPGMRTDGSGGGGGSGGAILVRAVGGITSTGAWLSAVGGGSTDNGSGDFIGGAGGVGRIRVDAPAGNVVQMATEPPAIRGPAWDPAAPFVVENQGVELPLRGHPGRSFGVLVDGVQAGDVAIAVGGTGDFTLPLLTGGRHQVCLVYAPLDTAPVIDRPEAISCIDVVYVATP